MTNEPQTASSMTAEQKAERIAQIDAAIIALEGRLPSVPGAVQESTQGDDDATESEFSEQEFGQIGQELEKLRREKAELQSAA